MTARVQLQKKISGRERQGAWRQEKDGCRQTATRKLTLSLTLTVVVS
jgi:hypothetical protein